MKSFQILSIKVDSLSCDEILKFIAGLISNSKKGQIATVNNEFIVEAQKNRKFAASLNNASLCLPDSTGVVWAVKKTYGQKIEKTPGADLFERICQFAEVHKYRIFLLGGRQGVAIAAKEELQKKYHGLHIVGTIDGIKIDPSDDNRSLISAINQSNADIIFVALGAPKQELWISNNLGKINAHVFIGVGGTLDFISRRIIRAPGWIRKLDLEWLFRLFIEPKRLKRIITALIVFPYLILTAKDKTKGIKQ